MTGTGSGYIGNGCVLNPFAGITLLYLHDSFPFIEARSVPHCTPTIQPERNPLITPRFPCFILLTPISQHSMPKAGYFSANFDCRLSVPARTADACSRKIFLPDFVGERIFRCLLARTYLQSCGQKNNQPFGTECIRGKIKKLTS